MSFVLEVILPSVSVKDDSFWSQAQPSTYVSSLTRRLNPCNLLSPVCRQITSAVWVALIGSALGMSIAFPAIALDAWTREGDVHLTDHQAGWFACVVQLISIPGSVLGGYLTDQLGPRRLLMLLLPSLAVSWFALLPAIHYPTLLIAIRAVQGALVSACAVSVYVYPCEVSEAGRRGMLGTMAEAAYSLGYLLTYLLAAFFHWSTVVLLLPPCVFLPCIIAVTMVPESPAWLLRNNKVQEAKSVLQHVRPAECNVEKELLSMQMGKTNDQELNEVESSPGALLMQPRFLLPVVASITLVILKECTGQIVVVLLAVNIFRKVNLGVSPYWSSVFVASARLAANLLCSLLLSYVPRRPILSIASFVSGLAMVQLANYFYTSESGLWPEWVPLMCLVLFVVAYGGGVGPVAFLIGTEMLPGAVRGIACGLSSASVSTMQFVLTYVATKSDSQLHFFFYLFATGCLVLAGFTLLLPETQNKKLEEIEQFWSEVAHRLTQSGSWSRRGLTPGVAIKEEQINISGSDGHMGSSVMDYAVVNV
ncbi:facilitated trehalose transporter Tret1-like [Panulirus ornatus]|uniref:facilitated trehalose transporter Tret1-like n=1 Tax=Panulirus ornatus TaxID=150431 RepID=UPI003A86D9A6